MTIAHVDRQPGLRPHQQKSSDACGGDVRPYPPLVSHRAVLKQEHEALLGPVDLDGSCVLHQSHREPVIADGDRDLEHIA